MYSFGALARLSNIKIHQYFVIVIMDFHFQTLSKLAVNVAAGRAGT